METESRIGSETQRWSRQQKKDYEFGTWIARPHLILHSMTYSKMDQIEGETLTFFGFIDDVYPLPLYFQNQDRRKTKQSSTIHEGDFKNNKESQSNTLG